VIVNVLVASLKEIVGLSVGLRQTTCDASTENSVVLISTKIDHAVAWIIFTTQTCVIKDHHMGFTFVSCPSVFERYKVSLAENILVSRPPTSPNFVTYHVVIFSMECVATHIKRHLSFSLAFASHIKILLPSVQVG